MVCRVSRRNGSTSEELTVSSVSGADITFTAAVTLSVPVMIEFAGWASATAKQRRFAYVGRKRWS
jgi:hypothetical protein